MFCDLNNFKSFLSFSLQLRVIVFSPSTFLCFNGDSCICTFFWFFWLYFFLCHLRVSVPFLWSLDFLQCDSKPMARTVDYVNRSECSQQRDHVITKKSVKKMGNFFFFKAKLLYWEIRKFLIDFTKIKVNFMGNVAVNI